MTAITLGLALLAAAPEPTAGPQIAHMVYFRLKDQSEPSRAAFAKSCQDLLGDIEGVTFFAVGTLPPEPYEPAVNDRDYDVALHVVFRDKAAHTGYLKHPKHDEFVKVNKDKWAKVRVFDAVVPTAPKQRP